MRIGSALRLLIGVLIGGSTAHGAEVGSHWLTLIQSLKDKGVTRIGDFDLETFRRQAREVPFLPATDLPPSVLAGSRGSAYYLTYERKIYILADQPKADLASLPQLEVHELIGALRYGDANTAKSTALVAIDETKDSSARAALVRSYGREYFQKSRFVSDGGFSVGGGGDLSAIHVKSEVFRQARRMGEGQPNLVSSDFFRRFPAIGFEPLRKGNQVAISYKYELKDPKGFSESFAVYVPMKRWAKSEEERKTLVREIATKLISIFPIRADAPRRSFTPPWCRNGETISFPIPIDEEVARTQDMRGAVMLGCRRIPGQTSGENLSGVTRDFEEPKAAGIFHYACSLAIPGFEGAFQFPLQSQAGVGGGRLYSAAFEQTLFTAGLYVNGTGQILGATLETMPREGKGGKLQQLQKSADPSRAQVSLAIPTGTLTLKCRKER